MPHSHSLGIFTAFNLVLKLKSTLGEQDIVFVGARDFVRICSVLVGAIHADLL